MHSPAVSPSLTRPTRGMSSSSMPVSPNLSRPLRSSSASSTTTSAAAPPPTTSIMTIEEMRRLHQRALRDAEAKRTELRLVLASRYRELVGSSDEVLTMKKRAEELHTLVHALPSLVAKMKDSQGLLGGEEEKQESRQDHEEKENASSMRRDLSRLPRVVHRALDNQDVHEAATALMTLFDIIATCTEEFEFANVLSAHSKSTDRLVAPPDPLLMTQVKMTFLHVQTLPKKTIRLAKQVILGPSTTSHNDTRGAWRLAAALSTLSLLQINDDKTDTTLLDLYFDSKAKYLQTLLSQLTTTDSAKHEHHSNTDEESTTTTTTHKAEQILSQIVLILQYDIIVNPYQIFCLRNFPTDDDKDSSNIVSNITKSLPNFDPHVVKSKASHFLAAHLPLIRNKVRVVLQNIAGTTASALGQIRQSLYDKTDGIECMERLDSNGVCTWEEAVNAMVDVRVVLSQSGGGESTKMTSSTTTSTTTTTTQPARKLFSLWSALFSHTFGSLVHMLLTTSFHSVHAKVVSTLRKSLMNAPLFTNMLPHEAYRNTLRIATELDAALLKVSDDAHELLVHAEERQESERRLRQSLYVQTCEIMGRLVCELRRMLWHPSTTSSEADATKELIVGRLCYLLKFRLTSLSTLLNPESSPSAMATTTASGMISLLELQSAFDLADDNEDGLITFEEATEAVESAFSGTPFHGGEMVRETLLMTSKGEEGATAVTSSKTAAPTNVTLNELALLSARGLRHDATGPNSALGTIQVSLDSIIAKCFTSWAQVALTSAGETFTNGVQDFLEMACTTSESEWKRIYASAADTGSTSGAAPLESNVSPHAVGFLLSVSSVLNRSVCPSDSLVPVPSVDYASALGIPCQNKNDIPTLVDTVRVALLEQSVQLAAVCLDKEIMDAMTTKSGIGDDSGVLRSTLADSGPSSLQQLHLDVSFLQFCFFRRNKHGFSWGLKSGANEEGAEESKNTFTKILALTERLVRKTPRGESALASLEDKHAHVLEVCDLFLSALLGEDDQARAHAAAAGGVDLDAGSSWSSNAAPLLHNPLPSARRFALLPIQSDRSLSELQRRSKYGRDKNERADSRQDLSGSGVIGSGLGFISSMLKKK